MVFSVLSDREGGITTLVASNANLDGDQGLTHGLPPGFGDCVVSEIQAFAGDIATLVATPEYTALSVAVTSASGTVADIVGAERWTRSSASGLVSRVSPHEAVYVRALDLLLFTFPELDVNASPTLDFTVYARVVRIRNMPSPQNVDLGPVFVGDS